MKKFEGSGLVFEFDENWEVCQLDGEADYRKKICCRIPGTRCIDFIGFNKTDHISLFVEVKSFRGYRDKRNVDRLTGERDDIALEGTQKERESLATIVGGARNSTHRSQEWKEHVEHLNKNGHLKVIAWIELDVSTENLLKRAKMNMSVRRKDLRKRLVWLTSDVDILNTCNYDRMVNGLTVNIQG